MVIPVYDRNPTHRTPYVTYLLLALNVVVFLMQPISRLSVTGDVGSTEQLCRQEAFFERWGAIPKELVENEPRAETVTGPGPRPNTCVVGEPDYEKVPFLSALTSTFLHGGWLHLLGKQLGVRPRGWREVTGPYGEDGSRRSVADITGSESLLEVRAYKQEMKAAAKAAKPAAKK